MGGVVNIDAQGAQFDEDGGAFDVSRVSLSTALMVGGAGYFAGQRAVDALRWCNVQVQVRLAHRALELLGRLRVLCVAVFVTGIAWSVALPALSSGRNSRVWRACDRQHSTNSRAPSLGRFGRPL